MGFKSAISSQIELESGEMKRDIAAVSDRRVECRPATAAEAKDKVDGFARYIRRGKEAEITASLFVVILILSAFSFESYFLKYNLRKAVGQ